MSRLRNARRKVDSESRISLPPARPEWIPPCRPILVPKPPSGPGWSHEIKHDGYRCCAINDGGTVRLYTRRGHDWSSRMPAIAAALGALRVRSAIIDGEVATLFEDGSSDFFALHAALAKRSAPGAVLVAFDMLHLDGEDLRGRPLEDRRAVLADVLGRSPHSDKLQISEEVADDGPAVHRVACELGLEGIVSKRRGSPYVSGLFDGWRKAKCGTLEHLAVTGIELDGKRKERRSVMLARVVGDMQLVPCGSAGSGLTDQDLREIRSALRAGLPIIAEVEHRGLTPDGQLRHPVVRSWKVMI